MAFKQAFVSRNGHCCAAHCKGDEIERGVVIMGVSCNETAAQKVERTLRRDCVIEIYADTAWGDKRACCRRTTAQQVYSENSVTLTA